MQEKMEIKKKLKRGEKPVRKKQSKEYHYHDFTQFFQKFVILNFNVSIININKFLKQRSNFRTTNLKY